MARDRKRLRDEQFHIRSPWPVFILEFGRARRHRMSNGGATRAPCAIPIALTHAIATPKFWWMRAEWQKPHREHECGDSAEIMIHVLCHEPASAKKLCTDL